VSHSAIADKITQAFVASLRELGASVRTMAEVAATFEDPSLHDLFLSLGRADRKVFLVPSVGLINVHVRSDSAGFWGVHKTVKKDFEALAHHLEIPGYFVFLVGRGAGDRHVADGYISSDLSSSPFVRPARAQATNYKINEKQDLDISKKLLGISKIAKVLLQNRWAAKP
jgi:hypothetical protein